MFGLGKRLTRLEVVERQLDSIRDHLEILNRSDEELRDQIRDLKVENAALCIRTDQLETNQKQLRTMLIRMGECLGHDKQPDEPTYSLESIEFLPPDHRMPITDHIHENNDRVMCPPEECIYCHRELNTRNND